MASQPLDASIRLLISQWYHAPVLRGFIGAIIEAKRKGILEPLEYIAASDNLDNAKGYWLDQIGELLGLERPVVDITQYTERFGFAGSGVGFDTSRYGDSTALPVLAPAGDELYRNLLRARGWALISMGGLESLRKAIAEIDPDAVLTDGSDMSVTVRTDIEDDMQLAKDVRALPKPTGVRMRIIGSSLWGFKGSGIGFDLGRYGGE